MVSIAATKLHDQKASWGGKGLYLHIAVQNQRKSGQELKQGRNLEAGADAEATEECCLLACSYLLSLLSYSTQGHYPSSGTTHNGFGPPSSTVN